VARSFAHALPLAAFAGGGVDPSALLYSNKCGQREYNDATQDPRQAAAASVAAAAAPVAVARRPMIAPIPAAGPLGRAQDQIGQHCSSWPQAHVAKTQLPFVSLHVTPAFSSNGGQ
jgi:hypothetical protein